MGIFTSCCERLNVPDVEKRFHIIDITDISDQSSDDSLKGNITSSKKDVTPLLEGPTLLAFRNLNLSSSSSSTDLDINKINNFFKTPEETENPQPDPKPSDTKDDNDEVFMGAVKVPSD